MKTYANEKSAKAAIRKVRARTHTTIDAVTYPHVDGRVVPTITVTGAPDGALDGFTVVVNEAEAVATPEAVESEAVAENAETPKEAKAVETTPKKPRPKKGSIVNFAPNEDGVVEKVREGTKQAAMITALKKGCTIRKLRNVCVRKDGTGSWPDGAIISALYYDVKKKGYGIRTEAGDGPEAHKYFLVEPPTATPE